ncbi:hypothetical protein QFZ62_000309 [Clavibacter sp. B3I6]|uniref:hypothetical protein n=1 Tax=Clavibacter sp. B3I6 TaxID=3042268 RepID=UPI00278A03E4|nr:hypothetical protein [Clavibacter sp. B3I6]MDQ0743001.1 hypothetical protein [Clavibacter sp. B3I6]
MNLAARAAANTLLDLYSSTQSGDLASQEVAFSLSMRRLSDLDAVVATQDDNGDLTLDFTPLLLAAGVTHQWLFDRLAAATGSSTEELTFELRAAIDRISD